MFVAFQHAYQRHHLRVAPVYKIVAAVILVSLSLLFLLTGIPTTIFFAVECLHTTQPDIHNAGAYEGNVMIVTEVYPALTSKSIVEKKSYMAIRLT